ncbi:hypothetical protein MJG53_015217 [Ovis ammon polii x Ovis aries]|uniref:Uncharacterized protein n=1 Tax=Ovis ammon polii x Ovis aries TaxID=2918886 RepID=A0ACB9UE40_9CETA|nr:hypothetical protein MJG53_015217 [Ovis ammon polii x Ovis aries]
MLLCVTLLLLLGLSACTVAGDKKLAVDAEVGSWVAVTLEEDVIPSILLQLRDMKKGKASQFFGLMGKQGISENHWSRGKEEQLQKAKRMRTMGQSESPHPTPPRGRNPSPYLDVAANQPTRPALCSMSSVLIMRSSHHAELTGLLPGLSFSSSSRA